VKVPQLIGWLFYYFPGGSCVFIFFACAKKTEPKESTPDPSPRFARSLALLGILRVR
jgi:hypothetical protein